MNANDPAFAELFQAPASPGAVQKMNTTSGRKDLTSLVAARNSGVDLLADKATLLANKTEERCSQPGTADANDVDLAEYRELVPPPKAPPLANRKKPFHNYQTKQERPAHRLMLEYAARGYNVKEIAELTGYTPVAVNNILRQEHVQETLVETIRHVASADEEVVRIIKDNVVKSVKLYEAVLNDPSAELKERMEAAERFLNRRYGKPNQPINRGTEVDLNTLSDAELIEMAMNSSSSPTSTASTK